MMTRPSYISSLTSLRGIAAILICFYHFEALLSSHEFPGLIDPHLTQIISKGYLWVDFFFILSGFVITYVYGDKLRISSPIIIKKYLWARFSRIYPMHFTVMFFALALHILFKSSFTEYSTTNWWILNSDIKNFLGHLALLQTTRLVEPFSWNVPTWSIAAEFWTYFLAIAIVPLLYQKWKYVVLASIVSLIGFWYIYDLRATFLVGWESGNFRCLFGFILGISTLRIYKLLHSKNSILGNDVCYFGLVILVLISLHFSVSEVWAIASFCLLILSTSLNRGVPNKILNTRPLIFLGNISYSVYILHGLLCLIWSWWIDLDYLITNPYGIPGKFDQLIWLLTFFFTLLMLSYLSHRYIEIPSKKTLRALIN